MIARTFAHLRQRARPSPRSWRPGVSAPGARRTTRNSIAWGPNIVAFLEHCLDLAKDTELSGRPMPVLLTERDRKHLDSFFDDALDPRAWNGVYKVIGEDVGHHIKEIFKTRLRPDLA